MKKIILALGLATSLLVSGCAGFKEFVAAGPVVTAPFDQPTYETVRSSYGAVISVANGYRDACARRLIPSSCRTVVRQMQQYDARVYPLVRAARGDATYLNVALAAVNEFKAFQQSNGVR